MFGASMQNPLGPRCAAGSRLTGRVSQPALFLGHAPLTSVEYSLPASPPPVQRSHPMSSCLDSRQRRWPGGVNGGAARRQRRRRRRRLRPAQSFVVVVAAVSRGSLSSALVHCLLPAVLCGLPLPLPLPVVPMPCRCRSLRSVRLCGSPLPLPFPFALCPLPFACRYQEGQPTPADERHRRHPILFRTLPSRSLGSTRDCARRRQAPLAGRQHQGILQVAAPDDAVARDWRCGRPESVKRMPWHAHGFGPSGLAETLTPGRWLCPGTRGLGCPVSSSAVGTPSGGVGAEPPLPFTSNAGYLTAARWPKMEQSLREQVNSP